MKDVTQILLDRTAELKLDAAALSQMLSGKVHRQTIYNLVNDGAEINTRSLSHVLRAIGLKIVPIAGFQLDTKARKSAATKRNPTRSNARK